MHMLLTRLLALRPLFSIYLVVFVLPHTSAQYLAKVDLSKTSAFTVHARAVDGTVRQITEDGVFELLHWADEGQLRRLPGVLAVEPIVKLMPTRIPNDTLYEYQQVSYDQANLPKMWETVTDAVDYKGRELVVAVLDLEVMHPDLIDNIYLNQDEIPDNGIDDDGNGLIDDYRGWNVDSRNGIHKTGNHGVGVAGIIGASGDNVQGVSGVCWDVKILPISGIDLSNELIEAFDHLRRFRQLYNDTNGEQGVRIVVSNVSASSLGTFGRNHPIWCEMYDKLAEVGILSVGSVTNFPVDVGIAGDMPSTCESSSLLIATNLDRNGDLFRLAGYSDEYVDLAAPGDMIHTTVGGPPDHSYHGFTGTSAAAPHVAGVAALLFAAPCPAMADLIDNDPPRAVQYVREAILTSTTSIASLDGFTVSGGALNAGAALDRIQIVCGGGRRPLSLLVDRVIVSGKTLSFVYQTPDRQPVQVRLYDASGRLVLVQQVATPFYEEKTAYVDVGSCAAGLYHLSIMQADAVITKQIVVF